MSTVTGVLRLPPLNPHSNPMWPVIFSLIYRWWTLPIAPGIFFFQPRWLKFCVYVSVCVSVCVFKITEKKYNIKNRFEHFTCLGPSPSVFRSHSPAYPTTTQGCFHLSASRPDWPKASERKDVLPSPLMLPPPSPGLTSSQDDWWSDSPFVSGETPASTPGTG